MLDLLVNPTFRDCGQSTKPAAGYVGLKLPSTQYLRYHVLDLVYPFHSSPAVQAKVWRDIMPLLPQWFQYAVDQGTVPYQNPEDMGVYARYLGKPSASEP